VSNTVLLVSGTEYAGWKEIQIERSLDTISGAFSLSVSDRWEAGTVPWPIKPGDECQILADGEVLITGFVDVVNTSFSGTDHSITVQGRDKSGDMVDSSADNQPGSWENITIGDLAKKLAEPFGVKVTDESGDKKPFPLAKLQPSETPYEMIERYARQRGILTIADGKGGIILTKPGNERAGTSLVQGVNILSASGTADHSSRYSEYLVTGQNFGTDFAFGDDAAQLEAKSKDLEIRTARKLRIIAANATDTKGMQAVAEWESTVRAARSSPLKIKVQGWRQSVGGSVWKPGQLVSVQSSFLRMDQPKDMIINAVSLSKSDGGTFAELELMRPSAYKPKPEQPQEENLWGAE
jgi:prophage tail gpP-like protein